MGASDLAWATGIVAAVAWLLFRSLLARPGGCHGCPSGASCHSRAGGGAPITLGRGTAAPPPGAPGGCRSGA